MKIRLFTSIICLLTWLASPALSELDELDRILADRASYVEAKENRIDSLKHTLRPNSSAEERSRCYDALYREYLTFNFDSAMAYLERAGNLTGPDTDYADKALIEIHRALSMATSGHFSEAADLLEAIDAAALPDDARRELYAALHWTYGAWAEYSGTTSFAAAYRNLSNQFLDSLLVLTDKNTPDYNYHFADRALSHGDYAAARMNYEKALESTPRNTRLYAQAAYGLANAYRGLGDTDNYRRWLINAAISDQITPLKENLALQELALDIKNRDGNLEQANRYLKYSLEDAIFYNNRLRLLEISGKFPDIALGYQDTITAQNKRLKTYVLIIGVLFTVLAISICITIYEKKKVSASRHELSALNGKLQSLNARLAQTNASREQYVSLFMDLCAVYIEKLNQFRLTVVLKVKARQFDDLLRVANNNARPTEAEMKGIFFNFDTAFLRLYPDFIERFNTLLKPGQAILPKSDELLNTDLRIYALIRMGIKDSTKIATLLFYSPQTIFNHRTQVRNKALNRDTFEQDVMDICAVMPSDDVHNQ